MPKAIQTSITPASAASPPAEPAAATSGPALPSIADLGRRLAALGAEYDRLDVVGITAKGGESVAARLNADLIAAQRDALRDLVLTMPATTIEDAAVQVALLVDVASDLAGSELNAEDVAECADRLERVLLGMLPVVAAAARLDVQAMNWSDLIRLRAARFAALERIA